jgi:hypothetical protein
MFYARREPFITNLDQAPDEPKSIPSRLSQTGNAPVLQDPIKSPQLPEAGTHFRKTFAGCLAAASDISSFCSRKLGCDSSRTCMRKINNVYLCRECLRSLAALFPVGRRAGSC